MFQSGGTGIEIDGIIQRESILARPIKLASLYNALIPDGDADFPIVLECKVVHAVPPTESAKNWPLYVD